jgi:hypothetical protein
MSFGDDDGKARIRSESIDPLSGKTDGGDTFDSGDLGNWGGVAMDALTAGGVIVKTAGMNLYMHGTIIDRIAGTETYHHHVVFRQSRPWSGEIIVRTAEHEKNEAGMIKYDAGGIIVEKGFRMTHRVFKEGVEQKMMTNPKPVPKRTKSK